MRSDQRAEVSCDHCREYSHLLKSIDSQGTKIGSNHFRAAAQLRNSSTELAKKKSLLSFVKPSTKVFEFKPPHSPKNWQKLAAPGTPHRKKDFIKLNKQTLAGGISEYAKQLRQADSGMLEKLKQVCNSSPSDGARETALNKGRMLKSQGTATFVGDDFSIKNYQPSVASDASTHKRPLTSNTKLLQAGPLHSSCFSKSSYNTSKFPGPNGSRIEINLYGKTKDLLFNERKPGSGKSTSTSQSRKIAAIYSPKNKMNRQE